MTNGLFRHVCGLTAIAAPIVWPVVANGQGRGDGTGRSQGRGPGTGRGALGLEKLPDGMVRIGSVLVDVAAREVSVGGVINDVPVLEWVANTEGGMKAYESAISADTNAIAFNTALLLIGLDQSRARVPTRHFDPIPPEGDPVEVWVEWRAGAPAQRVRIEQLLLDRRTGTTLPEGPWVYTGSSFLTGNRLMAQLDGVLIGFVHSPAPLIENPRAAGLGAYGSIVLNRKLIPPGTFVTLIVKALPRPGDR